MTKTCLGPWVRVFSPGHQVVTVQQIGFAGMANGALLAKLEGHYEVFVTADRNLRYQQNIAGRGLAIVELPTNRLHVLTTMITDIVAAVTSATPGSYTQIVLPTRP